MTVAEITAELQRLKAHVADIEARLAALEPRRQPSLRDLNLSQCVCGGIITRSSSGAALDLDSQYHACPMAA